MLGLTKTKINSTLNEGTNTDLTDCTDGGCCPCIMVLPLQGALPCGMFTQGVAPFHSACPGLRGVAPSGRVAMRFAVRVDLYMCDPQMMRRDL